jgi:hypothetical protein
MPWNEVRYRQSMGEKLKHPASLQSACDRGSPHPDAQCRSLVVWYEVRDDQWKVLDHTPSARSACDRGSPRLLEQSHPPTPLKQAPFPWHPTQADGFSAHTLCNP